MLRHLYEESVLQQFEFGNLLNAEVREPREGLGSDDDLIEPYDGHSDRRAYVLPGATLQNEARTFLELKPGTWYMNNVRIEKVHFQIS